MKKNIYKGSIGITVVLLVIIIVLLSLFLVKDFLGGKKELPPGNTVTTTDSQSNPATSPKEVVETYTNLTLGTVPGSTVDYDQAKNYLADNLKQQFTDSSFVPLSYSIQNGPDNVIVKSENISGTTATVLVDGQWGGETQKTWQFDLEIVNNEWKIKEIKNL